MPAAWPDRFEREMGCTEREWLQWLPGAVRGRPLTVTAGEARVAIGEGALHVRWSALPHRQIALVRLPRLHVEFAFSDVNARERETFMRYFDLHMQRGGG